MKTIPQKWSLPKELGTDILTEGRGRRARTTGEGGSAWREHNGGRNAMDGERESAR